MPTPADFDEAMDRINREISKSRISVHSVLLSEDGELINQWHLSDHHRNTPHRMYSISKSITAIGVGLLIDDGAFALESTMGECFPEFAPMHPWVEQATVRDLLQMRSPHSQTTYKRYDGPWIESFFRIEPTNIPGTVFRYDTSASHTLAALVERTVNQSMTDFLQQRVWQELGASDQIRYVQSPQGTSSGGSGLICMPQDLMHIAHWLNNDGRIGDRQILSQGYIELATTKQVPTVMQSWGTQFHYGYGFQTWIPAPGAYLFFGMGGQIVLSIPEHKIVLVVTADTQRIPTGEQFLLDLMCNELIEPLFPGALAPTPFIAGGQHLADPTPWEGSYRSATPGSNEELSINVTASGGQLELPGRGLSVPFSYSEPTAVDNLAGFGYATITGGWVNENSLKLICEIQDEEVSSLEFELFVDGDTAIPSTVTMNSQGYGELIPTAWSGVQTFALNQ